MSRMNDLATILDELTSAATQLKMIAQDLMSLSAELHDTLLLAASEEPARPEQNNDPPEGADEPENNYPQPKASPGAAPDEPPYTKEAIRAMLADLARDGRREEAKALVAKYANGGSFSDIDPARYPELAEEVGNLHA